MQKHLYGSRCLQYVHLTLLCLDVSMWQVDVSMWQREVERNSLITLNGQPTTNSRARLFDIIETRCAIIAEAHVRGAKHGISVRRVPHNAHAELSDAEHTWDLAHSTNSTVLSTFTKKFRGDQLSLLSRSWGTTARRTDGTAAPAPSLPDVS